MPAYRAGRGAPHPVVVAVRRRGRGLACAVMVTGPAANAYAVYDLRDAGLAAEPGLQRLVLCGVLVLGSAPFLRRHPAA
ncbi:hypothetical protein ACIQRS_12315 [Streptomyces termitum]|uniref:Uncharacterized protein n=1 Tax=Streptomyces termitum TaxID=67368 RepID=A0A918WC65_9ACTN|nr:hypothetical protein [Streptomyces termitum]GHA91191.1 hypothetical protein GCM10010305_38810 [Streptomyces termitum]